VAEAQHRTLYVGWQEPDSKAIEPVAALVQVGDPGGRVNYCFYYLRRIKKLPGFEPFTAFPDTNKVDWSTGLHPFFENRLWPRKRSDYARMMEILGLSIEADPFEVLARSGGHRATDQLEVFPEPERDPTTGMGRCFFFVRGLRYFPEPEKASTELQTGAILRPLLDVQNPMNEQAVLLLTDTNRILGYVPDYLTSHVHEMLKRCDRRSIQFGVVHVNSANTPHHMRVLCRLTTCWPEDYHPFSGEDYLPLADGVEIPNHILANPASALRRPSQ
jgi:hypothetical protein